jgi:peptide/nickel transport system substrate-binding protein
MRRTGSRAWKLGLGALAVGATLAVAGCGGDDSGDGATTSGGSSGGTAAAGGTYRVEETDFGFTDAFDPSGEYLGEGWAKMRNLMVRTLVGYNHVQGTAGNELRADLATEVPTSSDNKTWTFTIKDGVKFAPPVNRQVTSKDVAYALERIATPSVAAQYGGYYNMIEGWDAFEKGDAKTISGISTPDAKTITITLTEPVPDFLYRMAMPAAGPIPREVGECFEGAGEYGRYLIPTGPYMFEGTAKLNTASCSTMKPIAGFDPARKMILVRNPAYDPATDSTEARSALPDRFEFTINTNDQDIFDKIQAGQVDDSPDAPPPNIVRSVSRDDAQKERLKTPKDDRTDYITMNVTAPPFDDVHVRRAVNFVMDKAAIQQAWGGPIFGDIATHIVPDTLYNDDPSIVDYNPYPSPEDAGDVEAAKNEMKQSKYDTNQDGVCDAAACKDVFHVARNFGPYKRMVPIIEDSVGKIGITLNTRQLPTSAGYTTIQTVQKQVPISSVPGWGKDYADASTFMELLFKGTNILATGNTNYSLIGITPAQAQQFRVRLPAGAEIPNVDADVDTCLATGGDERIPCWVALDKKLMEEVVPWVPYLNVVDVHLISPKVTKWEYDQASGATSYAHVAVQQ